MKKRKLNLWRLIKNHQNWEQSMNKTSTTLNKNLSLKSTQLMEAFPLPVVKDVLSASSKPSKSKNSSLKNKGIESNISAVCLSLEAQCPASARNTLLTIMAWPCSSQIFTTYTLHLKDLLRFHADLPVALLLAPFWANFSLSLSLLPKRSLLTS